MCLDQMFSVTAGYLRTHNATDRNGVLESIKHFVPNWSVHEHKPYVRNLDRAADISGWLKPSLSTNLQRLTEFRQFEIQLDSNQEVVVRARACCKDDDVHNKWSSLSGVEGQATKVFVFNVCLYILS